MYAPQLLGGANRLALFDFCYRYETAGPSIKRLPVKHWGGGGLGGELLTSFSYGSHTYQSFHLFPVETNTGQPVSDVWAKVRGNRGCLTLNLAVGASLDIYCERRPIRPPPAHSGT